MLRLSYLPPLMVYVAFGVQGLTGIVGTFFVKEYLDLSAEFLAALGFWVIIPWALKMPIGHIVDLVWRWKAALVWLGAAMLAASLGIMLGLISHTAAMRGVMSAEHWFVLSALLGPTGYMLQDVVADAMTVEAVPRADAQGKPYDERTLKSMHTTMQTLGRVAVIGGFTLVALVNVFLFHDTESLPRERKAELYATIYTIAFVIPVLSVLGVVLHRFLAHERGAVEKTLPNWWILGGSLAFVAVTLALSLGQVRFGQELIFLASLAIVIFLLWRLARELAPEAREVLLATALVIFIYRAVPSTGAGSTWWMIDVLKFDEAFLSKLALLAYALTLAAMFGLRRFMAGNSIAVILVILTLAGGLLALPNIGMAYGLHEWTAARTGGVVDARFIALIDTALESPLGQISLIPMLAWVANSAPAHLKATYFAVMGSFSNLALSASSLGTKYLNQVFTVTRGGYGEIGELMIAAALIGVAVPLLAVAGVRLLRLRTA